MDGSDYRRKRSHEVCENLIGRLRQGAKFDGTEKQSVSANRLRKKGDGNRRAGPAVLMHVRRRNGTFQFALEILPSEAHRDWLSTERSDDHLVFVANYVLFCSEKDLPKETWEEGDDTVVGEEELILAKQRTPSLEWFELPLEFLDANDATNELDACLLKEIFVFTLWVLSNKTDSRVTGIDEGVLDRADNV
jgi:hypothetical protein